MKSLKENNKEHIIEEIRSLLVKSYFHLGLLSSIISLILMHNKSNHIITGIIVLLSLVFVAKMYLSTKKKISDNLIEEYKKVMQ